MVCPWQDMNFMSDSMWKVHVISSLKTLLSSVCRRAVSTMYSEMPKHSCVTLGRSHTLLLLLTGKMRAGLKKILL